MSFNHDYARPLGIVSRLFYYASAKELVDRMTLEAFEKVTLAPGEEKVARFKLSRRDFACYDADLQRWSVHSGKFDILAGGSSRHLPLSETIEVQATDPGYPSAFTPFLYWRRRH